ncbi:MAG: threonine/serine exporter family protein [Clostridia bacterium]|nr:threonine/serine exporter family protein [Clostridia bacterium]
MEHITSRQLLPYVLDILQMMVESGAEIYRVEESAERMLTAYGFTRVDVYATTTNIILSLEDSDRTIKTHTRRIKQTSNDLEKIHRLNALVRMVTANKPGLEEIERQLEKIKNTPHYSAWLNILFYGIIAGAFYVFFGGRSLVEFAFSTLIGLVTGVLTKILEDHKANKILVKFFCSFMASFICYLLYKVGLVYNVDYIIIGNIMTLIPGIGLTNALRDLFTGDSISGVLKLIEAALLAVAIACGYIVTTILFGGAVV